MTTPDLRDWKHLGRALREARDRDRRSRAEVERLSGVSATQIKRYETGAVTPSAIPDKLWVLATFYRWTPDSLTKVLAGGEPRYEGEPDAPHPAPDPETVDKVLALVSQSDALTSAEKREVLRWLLARE